MTQETFLTAFVEGVQTTAERYIQISQFDKTISGIIKSQDPQEENLYYVSSYGCPNFSVKTLTNDKEKYSIGDSVYINIPNGDFSSSDKYIIGKVAKITPHFLVRDKENYLVSKFADSNPIEEVTNTFSNYGRKQELVIEFSAYINTSSPGLGIKEIIIPFTIQGKDASGEDIYKRGLWSSDNLYGNIFNTTIIKKQIIVVTGFENFVKDISINWDFTNNQVEVVYQNGTTGIGTIIFQNMKYYLGYSIEDLDNNSLYNNSILLTEEGPKYFYYKDDEWYLVDSLEDLNQMNEQYIWDIEWYDKNLLIENPSNSNIPIHWEKINTIPNIYKNKLVLLVGKNKNNNSALNKAIYSILE